MKNMIAVDQQLHGYRQGHQLLSGSIKLPKPDQDLLDRLSDVAGPLRPGDQFDPYLTLYPLPSGSHYVLAKTWQDFDAPRAGCVRTRSLILPMDEWVAGVDVVDLVKELSVDGPAIPAKRVYAEKTPHLLPQVDVSQVVELVEALFLEDRKPIVVFDSSDPEGIVLRLVAAVWPSFRRSFAASTFSLSPRSLGARSFDLVFAPKNARSRFSDWPGRRIDARISSGARHRWSHELVNRVFGGACPTLLQEDALGELSSKSGVTEAALRISLLWNELREKLETSPNAALGLLDIANSRSPRNISVIKHLQPELERAAKQAVVSLNPSEAWRFLLALTDKLAGIQLQLSITKAVRTAAVELASRQPADAIANVAMLAAGHGHQLLISAVGDGVARNFDSESGSALGELAPAHLLELLLRSPALASLSLTRYSNLSVQLATALADAHARTRSQAKRRLLRFLVEDWQADAARILIGDLNLTELLAETKLLSNVNNLATTSLHDPIVERARAIGAVTELRDTISILPDSRGTRTLLLRLIAATSSDLHWLLECAAFTEECRLDLVRALVRSASATQLKSMVTKQTQAPVIQCLLLDPAGSLDVIDNLLATGAVEAVVTVNATIQLLHQSNDDLTNRLVPRALEITLTQTTGTNHDAKLDELLEAMGARLNGSWAIQVGLKREVPGHVVATNLSAFNRSQPAVRQRIMLAVEDLARMIVARGRIDYPERAVADAADLLWSSARVNQGALIRSSATLLPFLLQSLRDPASPLIAAVFPPVYQELKRTDEPPDYFKFFFFTDLGKRKTARRTLVDALMHSTWRATDIALAAARADDIDRFLQQIVEHADGARVIADIENDLAAIPPPWRRLVKKAIDSLRGTRALS